jgi:hypothetical protein
MTKNALEEHLADLTREFVGKLVDALRNASLADVAALTGDSGSRAPRAPRPRAATAEVRERALGHRGPRQTATRRAEIGERLTKALASADGPLGVRALAEELGVDAGLLAVPLKELRAAGKVRKHGEKRATTYSIA